MTRLTLNRDKITSAIGRSGCTACDRNEAEFQLKRLDGQEKQLNDALTTLSQ